MRIHNKLRSRRGETLTETLVGILLVGLASVVLASMVGASSRMSAQALKRDADLYEEIASAETRTGDSSGGRVTVWIGGSHQDFSVTYYGEEGQLRSYGYEKGGGGA